MTEALRDAVVVEIMVAGWMEYWLPEHGPNRQNGTRHEGMAAVLAALAPHQEAEIARRVAEAVSAERAACAEVCVLQSWGLASAVDADVIANRANHACATAIRNRSEPQ